MKGLWFIIFVIVLQQVDGNVICPFDRRGIPGDFWDLGAGRRDLGRRPGGVAGMVIGVPILAVLICW